MFLSSIIIPRALCRGSLVLLSPLSHRAQQLQLWRPILLLSSSSSSCTALCPIKWGFWAPMKLLHSACGLTMSACTFLRRVPCTLRVQLHCNNNNKIVINGHFFVSSISIRYFCIVCYVEFVLLQIQRIIIYYAILMVIHSSPPPAQPWCGFDVMWCPAVGSLRVRY